jgi:AbrB family looped-hinge helix DNA binding protein
VIESTITKKGQTTLPKSVREVLGVQVGDRVRYVIFKGEVRILPVRPISQLFGVLQHDSVVTLEKMEQAIVDGACER